ncbi:MAG TPA: ABC transporter ATP-binding protein [Methyloceanibacter sp.]|jgi:zinc/manganese transport system ATP-binding protein
MKSIIGFSDLTLGYDRHPAVHHIDGEVERGEMLALVGPNGGGKSTLLKSIIGELKPLEGHIQLGIDRRDIAYLPQQIEIDRSFPISVNDCVALGLWRNIGTSRGVSPKQARAVVAALHALGLEQLARRPIGALSGGQFQRVLFARLLLQDASLILLDEPFRAVDQATITDLIALIRRWHKEGRTIIAALHDLGQVRANFPRTLLLAREVVAWGPTAKVLVARNLAMAGDLAQGFNDEAEICERHDREDERQSA